MNIIGMRQEKRAIQISHIQASIEKPLYAGQKIKYEDLVISVMANLNLSRRTAADYIQIALFNLKLTKEDLEKNGTDNNQT